MGGGVAMQGLVEGFFEGSERPEAASANIPIYPMLYILKGDFYGAKTCNAVCRTH